MYAALKKNELWAPALGLLHGAWSALTRRRVFLTIPRVQYGDLITAAVFTRTCKATLIQRRGAECGRVAHAHTRTHTGISSSWASSLRRLLVDDIPALHLAHAHTLTSPLWHAGSPLEPTRAAERQAWTR